jgi:phage tail P2-like protein
MWRTIDLLPDSLAKWELQENSQTGQMERVYVGDPQVYAACEAIDAELEAIYADIPAISFWPNVEQQTGTMLDIMMWEMHVDIWQNWNPSLTDDDKIGLINESIEWHQYKGTPWVVRRMIDQVFGPGVAVLTEWYQYRSGGFDGPDKPPGNLVPSDPSLPVGPNLRYKFNIAVGDMTAEQLDILVRSVNAVKNLRSWMDEISRLRQSKMQLYEGEHRRIRTRTKIHMSQRISPFIQGLDYFGVGTHNRYIHVIGAPIF